MNAYRAVEKYITREYFPPTLDDIDNFFTDYSRSELELALSQLEEDGVLIKEHNDLRNRDTWKPASRSW